MGAASSFCREGGQGPAQVTVHAEIRVDDLVDLHLVDVEMDDLCFGGKILHRSGDPVIEPGSHGQQQIASGDGHIGRPGAVHAGHAQILLPGVRYGAFAHQGVDHRGVGGFHQLAQGLRSARQDHTATYHEQGPFGFPQGLQGHFHFLLPTFFQGLVAPQRDGFG
jgi:hypothetical protein